MLFMCCGKGKVTLYTKNVQISSEVALDAEKYVYQKPHRDALT